MCELQGSHCAHKKRGHLTLFVGLVTFALLTAGCGRLTPPSATEATPQPAGETQTTAQETKGSTRPQPELPQDPKFTHITVEYGLSELPPELIAEFRQTILLLDKGAIAALIERVETQAPDTAKGLQMQVDDFQFGRIRDLLGDVK